MGSTTETEDQILDRLLGSFADDSPEANEPVALSPSPALEGLKEEMAKEPHAEEKAAEAEREKKREEAEHPEGAESEGDADESDGGEETPEKEVPPELETALQALRVAGFSSEDLEGMSDERIVSLGAKQAKMEADRKEHVRKLTADLKAAKESVSKSQVDSTESAELAEETTAKLADLMRPLAEDFGWDDTHSDALAKVVSNLTQEQAAKAVGPLRQKLEEAEAKLERANTAAFQALFDNARRGLGERIPRLKDEATFKSKVEPVLAKLDLASYGSVEDILLDAARLAGLRIYKSREEAEAKSKELSRAKANGTPTVTSKKEEISAMTAEERQDALLDHLFAGGKGEDFKAKFATR